MRFFPICCDRLGYPEIVPVQEDFFAIFNKIEIAEDMLVKTIYVPGSSGQSKLFNDLQAEL
jgi:hypothetical protein